MQAATVHCAVLQEPYTHASCSAGSFDLPVACCHLLDVVIAVVVEGDIVDTICRQLLTTIRICCTSMLDCHLTTSMLGGEQYEQGCHRIAPLQA